jgi:hypothetical protein
VPIQLFLVLFYDRHNINDAEEYADADVHAERDAEGRDVVD